jgi:hypothetical protein
VRGIREFPNKLSSRFSKKSGESDDLESQGRRNDRSPPQTDPELESTDFYDSSRRRRAVRWLHSIDGDLADVIEAAASR